MAKYKWQKYKKNKSRKVWASWANEEDKSKWMNNQWLNSIRTQLEIEAEERFSRHVGSRVNTELRSRLNREMEDLLNTGLINDFSYDVSGNQININVTAQAPVNQIRWAGTHISIGG